MKKNVFICALNISGISNQTQIQRRDEKKPHTAIK